MSTLCNFAVWCVFKAQRPRDKLLQRFHVPWDSSNLEVIKAGANAATTNSEGSFFPWISRVKQRFQIHLRDSWNSWAKHATGAALEHVTRSWYTAPKPPSPNFFTISKRSPELRCFKLRIKNHMCPRVAVRMWQEIISKDRRTLDSSTQSRHLVKSTSQGQHGPTGVFQAKK